ncbi:hemerythrin domain-containing protein [Kitasatospora sp. NPDC127111]|uniref:hemerythrin domain-containing protein n=1 Tax=Kitasatospora sp. NPDC127111 TaxID=3345363 RepID=UPI00362C5066
MADDAIELITSDHRQVERLFDQLRSGHADAAGVLEEVGQLLVAHSRAEEECVYPAVSERVPDEEEQIEHSREEHEEAEQLIERLRSGELRGEEFDRRLDELVDAVTHHVEQEEREVLPALREAVGERELHRLGEDFLHRRTEELRRLAGEAEDGSGTGTGDEPGDESGDGRHEELERATRAELYEKAKEARVEGRSRMSKHELVEALEREPVGH